MRSSSRSTRTALAAFSIVAVATLGLAGCSMSGAATESEEPAMSESAEPTEEAMEMDPAADLVGPGCADYAEQVPDGAGSVAGMAEDPVAVAASNNPILTTLTAAVSGQLNPEVDLVDTLNGDEFTVFAPVDDAFAKIDPATIESLKTDAATLSSDPHLPRRARSALARRGRGTLTTVQGGTVKVTGSGDDLKVNGAAVICGGVHTANATVYLIDSVLMPPAA